MRVVEDGPGRGHLCHTDTFLVSGKSVKAPQKNILIYCYENNSKIQ